MVRLTFPFFPEVVGRPELIRQGKLRTKKWAFPKSINAPKANNGKAYRRFPRFPKCPETGTPDFPAIPAAAIGAAGTITGRENGMDRDWCELVRNTYPHWMLMESLAMRDGGGTEHPHSILAGQSGRGQQRIAERDSTGSGRTEAIGNHASRRVWRNHYPLVVLCWCGIADTLSPIPTALPATDRKKQAIG